jgi:hypothetical protein
VREQGEVLAWRAPVGLECRDRIGHLILSLAAIIAHLGQSNGPSEGSAAVVYLAKMRLRHIVALTFVGWFLMMPPHAKNQEAWDRYCSTAPLSQWIIFKKYDSVKECEQKAQELQNQIAQQVKNHTIAQLDALPLLSSRCVAYDDPRLGEDF